MTARSPAGTTRTKKQRQAWWASLTPAEQAAYIERSAARRTANPSREALEAMARLDLATECGCFMADVPDEDVTARMCEMTGKVVA